MSVIVKSGSEICKANTNTSTAKYQYSFSKAERFPIPNLAEKIRTKKLQDKLDKGETLPVPIRESHYNFYELPSTKSNRRTTFGKGNKYDFTKVGNNCKEAYYNPRTDFDKAHPHGPMYSFTKADRSGKGKIIKKKEEDEENKEENKKKEMVDIDGPSPARYNYLKPFGYDAPKVSMKGRHNTPIKKKGEKEGEEEEKKEEKDPYLTKVTIQIRNTGKYVVSQIPNVNSIKFDKDKSKRTQFDANKNPGPDKYIIPSLICNKICESQYRNYEKIRISGRTNIKDSRSNYPGPGSYPLPSDFGIYESKDKDKYPKENVYPEKKYKPEDDKPWRHNMKKIKPKVEEEQNEDDNQYNQDENNNDESPNENNDQQNEETPEDKNEQAPEEKKEETPKEENKEENKEEDKKSEIFLLRDILVYKEGEDTNA